MAIEEPDLAYLGPKENITAETVDDLYDQLVELDANQEYESDFRHGDCPSNLPSQSSRHYEAKEVAMKMSDGSWVGWTFWYGGGKHGDAKSIEWMEDAYELDVAEKVVTIQEFTRK